MKCKFSFIVLAFCLLSSLTFAQDDEITLRLAINDPQGRPSEPYVLEFINQVNSLSNGSLTIEPFWDAGSEPSVIQLVIAGEADLGLVGSRAWNGEGVTSLDALQAPFLIDNDALAEAVATSDTATQMLEGMSLAGVVGLTMWPEDMRHPFAINPQPPFLSPEDFAGMNIRTTTSGVSAALIKALGGNPMFANSDYQGAESGLRQGGSLIGTQVATGNVTFFSKYLVLFANSTTFEKLSDEQKSILREAALATQTKAIAEHPREVDAATAYCAEGGTVVLASDEQLAAFEKAAQPVFDQIEQDPANAGYIETIRELKASTAPSAGAAACEPGMIQAGHTPSSDTEGWSEGLPPNGVWQVEFTAEDLAGSEMPLRQGLGIDKKSDWEGVYTFTLQDGKVIWQKPGYIYCKGSYELVEDVVRFSYALNDCDRQVDDMQWRLDNDGLHLQLVGLKNYYSDINAVLFGTKPWQKMGEPTTDTTVWEKGLPPNGTWQVELSLEDFQRMGIVRPWAVDWAGTYTFEFHDGKGALLYSGSSYNFNSPICEMYYEVAEDFIQRFVYTSGANCLNIIEVHQWRLDNDGLHIRLLDIINAPFIENRAVYEAKPWQKIE